MSAPSFGYVSLWATALGQIRFKSSRTLLGQIWEPLSRSHYLVNWGLAEAHKGSGIYVADVLQIAAGTPVVEIYRVALDADGLPVEVNEMTADSSAYVFGYEFGA